MAIRMSGGGPVLMKAIFDGGTVAGLGDGELLDRFASGRGEASDAAFSALVGRHGPMVLGACRRILADRHSAEDAFQATFLILARRAGSLRVGDDLGRWLYGVARRVALRERALSMRRPRPSGPLAEGWEDSEDVDPLRELAGVLDEEISRLPSRSREVIALCHFEGLSFVEAARRIGCAVGTVGSRLTRARALLGSRLARRGFAPAAILAGVAHETRAAVPASLARSTVRLAAGGPSGAIPAAVAALCEPTTRALIMTKWSFAAGVALVASAFVGGAGALQAPAPRPAPAAPSRASSDSGPVRAYEALVREYRALEQEDSAARREGEDSQREFRRKHPTFIAEEFTERFLGLAQAHPGDPISFDALLWVAVYGFRGEAADEAAAILARDHSRDPRLWKACQEMKRGPICPARGALLRAIHRDNPDRALRGRAGLALAEYLIDQAAFVRLAAAPGPGPYQGRFFPDARMDQFRKLDPDAMLVEAEAVCERVIRDYADVRPVNLVRSPYMDSDARNIYQCVQDEEADKGSLGDLARGKLEQIRAVDVGKPAPEIAGEDDRGKPMALGDFRGKVVVLTFSGNWCGPCVSMYPHERELVKRFQGRPFALVSVNSDETREQLRKSVEDGTITWRSWWESRAEGDAPIVDRWHVRAWPTIFLIDHKGIIRSRSTGTTDREGQLVTGMDEAIEALVKEAEAVDKKLE